MSTERQDAALTSAISAMLVGLHRGLIRGDADDLPHTAVIESLIRRKVVAFLAANQTTPGLACEPFLLGQDVLAGDRPLDGG